MTHSQRMTAPNPVMWTREIPFIDPVAAAARLRALPGLAFLDSAMRHDPLGRHSIVAADPFTRFRFRDGQAILDGAPVPGGPFAALRTCLAPYRIAPSPENPFPGGAIGYFAYDLGAALERVAAPARRAGLTDDIALNLYDTALVIDHAAGTCRLVATGFPEKDTEAQQARAEARLSCFAELLTDAGTPAATPLPSPLPSPLTWRSNFDRQSYELAVEKVRAYIRAGDIYQANIAQRFTADLPAGFDPFALYRRLRASNPATFGAYLELEGLTVASSSPERFIRLDGRHVETRPIKGTARRLDDPEADRAAAEALQASVKERAENVMIVDLLRNDLSRVCRPGSVAVPTLCGLETYANVHHLVSVVTGDLRDGLDALDLLEGTFPGGSITGAPKIRAMDIITEIEGDARELYCGAIGRIGFDGALDTSIAIRTVFLDERQAVLQAGGGVTLLSEPGPEYDETLAKAARVFEAFA
jgi:para-aminobenzoate synthetase component I